MQLPANEELVLVAGLPPIKAELKYYADANFRGGYCHRQR